MRFPFPHALRVPAVGGACLLGGIGVHASSGWPGAAGILLLSALLWWTERRSTAREEIAASVPDALRAPYHPVSGLQTREPLLARMAEDGAGTLGVLAFKDYDRLCAFDPEAGDRILRTLAERVQAMLPPDHLVAQVDRGHVAIWIGVATPRDHAERELNAVVYALGAAVADGSRDILPEVALRHIGFDGEGETARVALARTIASFAVTEPEGEEAHENARTDVARDRFLLEQDLRQAIARGELQLMFQPLVDAGEGRVCGAEALLRWHRVDGPVPPSRFVPIMEAAGLSREIGLWALNTALREVAGWTRGGLPALRVAVNVSGQQLGDADLPAVIGRMLARHKLPADALEVELTESVALNDTGRAATLVHALRDQGVAIAIDDFGTGFSSLSTMRRLAFDKIKIDREFVTDVHRRPESQAICQSIIALGRGLGIRVLAEGVETRAEVDWLRAHGCRHFQGFYFAPPLSSAEFVRFAGDAAQLEGLLVQGAPSLQQQIIRKLSA